MDVRAKCPTHESSARLAEQGLAARTRHRENPFGMIPPERLATVRGVVRPG